MTKVIKAKGSKVKGSYIAVSASLKSKTLPVDSSNVRTNLTFLVKGQGKVVEWNPNHGPVMIFTKAKSPKLVVDKHWLLGGCLVMNATFYGIKEHKLLEHFVEGNEEAIFSALSSYLNRP